MRTNSEEDIVRIGSSTARIVALGIAIGLVALLGCTKPTEPQSSPSPAATAPAESDSPFEPGQKVAATWTDGNYWHAEVTAVDGDQITVQFLDDKSTLTMPASDVRAIEETTWEVGDEVLAVWTSGRFYLGEITKVDGDTYTVKWDDGSSPSPVTADKIISAP